MRSPTAPILAALTLLAGPALAQEPPLAWIDGTTAEAGGVLIYGLPESDHVILSLRCDPDSFAVEISFTPDGELPPAASAVTLTLTSDGGKAAFAAERIHLEMLDVEIIVAEIARLDPDLVAILTTGDELAVNGDGVTMRLPVPDETVRTPFMTACAVSG